MLTLKRTLLMIGTLSASAAFALAQGRGGPPGPPPTGKAGAPWDPTGYWVSLVTEDWRYRMATPPKGDTEGVPLNPEGRKIAAAWDPAKDEGAGEQCKAYGVGGLMRLPTRLNINWQDNDTLKIETDAGTQTRLLHFRGAQAQGGDWQGLSLASWDRSASAITFGLMGPSPVSPGASLRAVTTKMKSGYLRKNGVPYSENATVTEYFDVLPPLATGETLLVVASEVVDPTYLANPFWTSTHFKKQKDSAGWNPAPCSSR